MGRRSVAVLDIRSSEIAVVVGERGVNNTIVFKASKTEPYDGYADGAFFDADRLSEAVLRAVSSVEKTCDEHLREIVVGIPGEFCAVIPREQFAGFPKKRRIGKRETDALFESGREELAGYRLVRATSMIYVTADNRRVVDPTGLVSTSLHGILAYFYCTDYFARTVEDIFSKLRIKVSYLPADYAMASYLIPSETRDECALFLDSGFLSTTLCVLLGNGVLAQETYWVGKGQIAPRLMEEFSLPYDAALALLSRANLYMKSNAGTTEFMHRGVSYEIDLDRLVDVVKEGLDGICEAVGGFLEDCSGKELDFKPLYVTGEGIPEIRGALEHVSRRINRVCELLVPDLPYYNKPEMSSRIALIDMACEDRLGSGVGFKF